MGLVTERNGVTGNRGTAYILAIGINRFASFHPLFNAKKDVQDFLAVLTGKYQFENEHVTCLFDKKATKNNIVGELIRLQETLKKDDSLLILFSGHGAIDQSNPTIGYWIPYDAKRNEVGDYLENFHIKKRLEGIKARHVLIIADSCYSHQMFKGEEEDDEESNQKNEILSSTPSRWFLASGRGKVHDGIPGSNSPFAKVLLKVFRESEEETLRISTVIEEVLDGVDLKYKQIARGEPLDMEGHEGGQFVFFKKDNYVLPPIPWLASFLAKILVITILFGLLTTAGYSIWEWLQPDITIVDRKETLILYVGEPYVEIEIKNLTQKENSFETIYSDISEHASFVIPDTWEIGSDSIKIWWNNNGRDKSKEFILDTIVVNLKTR